MMSRWCPDDVQMMSISKAQKWQNGRTIKWSKGRPTFPKSRYRLVSKSISWVGIGKWRFWHVFDDFESLKWAPTDEIKELIPRAKKGPKMTSGFWRYDVDSETRWFRDETRRDDSETKRDEMMRDRQNVDAEIWLPMPSQTRWCRDMMSIPRQNVDA